MADQNKPQAKFVERGRRLSTILLGIASLICLLVALYGIKFNCYDNVDPIQATDVNKSGHSMGFLVVVLIFLFIVNLRRLRSKDVKIPRWYLSSWLHSLIAVLGILIALDVGFYLTIQSYACVP
jgi:formate-dependent nitrite reductase membrane component NrfD